MGRANNSAQGVQTQPHSNLSNRQNTDLLSKAPGVPRSPVIGSSKQPLIAPGASNAIKGIVKTEQHKAELIIKKPTQLMIEATGLGPILTPSGGMNIVTGTGQTLRANRFQPTQNPYKEERGNQIRYKLPATLQKRIRTHIATILPAGNVKNEK